MEFRWNPWNVENIARHGVTPEEAEHVVRFAKRHVRHRRGSWVVYGRGWSNRRIEVIYVKDRDGTLYIIHAMPHR